MFRKKTRLVLHIGDPKTGTTSIQQALRLNLVSSPSGRVSGLMTDAYSANAVSLARSFTDKAVDKRPELIESIRRWLRWNWASHCIISSEFFAQADPQLVDAVFGQHFPKLMSNMRVVGYARPHLGRTLSAYTEEIRNGYTISDFEPWVARNIKKERLTCYPRFRQWQEVYGDRLIVRPFVRRKLKDADAVKDFFSIVFDGKPFAVQSAPEENQAISLRALSGLQTFNRRMAEARLAANRRIPLSRTIHMGLVPNPGFAKPQLDQNTIQAIVATHREDARLMDDVFFGEPLFEADLDQDFSDSPRDGIDLSLTTHFTAAERANIMTHATAIAEMPPEQIHRWHRHYLANRKRRNQGQPMTDPGGEIQKRLDELSACLS